MNKKQLITLVSLINIFFLCSTSYLKAQPSVNKFSTNPTEFFGQLKDFMLKTKDSRAEETYAEFVKNSEAGSIKPEQSAQIIDLCNLMLEKRMKTYPHFTLYLQSINNMAKQNVIGTSFNSWNAIAKKLVSKISKGDFNNFNDYIEFSADFIQNQQLYKTAGKKWYAKAKQYSFLEKNDTVMVNLPDCDLIATTAKDSVAIYATKGTYYPLMYLWKGEKGKCTWERANLPATEVYAELTAYTIDFKKNGYRAENATLYNNKYFKQPLKGRVIDEISSKINGEYLFPQFESYQTDIKITDIVPQVSFLGGFGMNGARLICYNNEPNRAVAIFYSKDKRPILNAKSLKFGINPSKEVASIATQASLYFGTDSIYHPNLNLRFLLDNQELRLVRDEKASGKVAFMSSYHQLEAKLDGIFWEINKPVLNFKMVTDLNEVTVTFESANYFEAERLREYTRITDIDPVAKLKEYADGGEMTFEAKDFAKNLNENYSVGSILNSIFQMVEDGFVYFDVQTNKITIRPKALEYLEAKKGKIDYDRILIRSTSNTTQQENAQLDIDTKELLITGVKRIGLSDSQKVYIYPQKGITRVGKNRDMKTDGTIVAGNVDFIGKDFNFNYDPFLIKMDSVDKMQIYLEDKSGKIKPLEGTNISPVQTLIQNVTGTLFIDNPTNKSGRKRLPDFPKFESEGNSFVYYDRKDLYNGAYKRDTFYFKLEPFTFKDLDQIQPNEMDFPGTMVAGNIFPAQKHHLTIQPDFSLGFNTKTEANGLSTYGKGNFTGNYSMSNQGMKGNGEIKYMAGGITSPEFTFVPDSMFATCDSFFLERKIVKGVEFPSAHNSKVKVRWLPAKDSMIVRYTNRPFMLYEDQISFKGSLIVADKGLFAQGIMAWKDASMRANDFTCKSGTFKSDSADVVIKNAQAAKVAFDSYNVKARVDMDKKLGEFAANGATIPISLPYNMYKTYAKEFFWQMEEKLVNIRMPEDGSGYFQSTHPDQAGLKFSASGGVVNLNDNTIQVDGIPYIAVGDAKIQPNNTQVIIEGEAKMKTLENALLVCDTTNQYHTISNGTFNIKSSHIFEGKGEYKYKGKGMKKQTILFDAIMSKENEENKNNYYTLASTAINPDQDFKLESRIKYKGNVTLDSRKQFLVFDGFTKLDLNSKDFIDAQWFKINNQIDPDNITVDVTNPIGERTDTLSFGILQDMQAVAPYAAFLTGKRTPLDTYFFRTTGDLNFDSETSTYRVAPKERIEGKTEQGNMLTLKDADNKIIAEGTFDMGQTWGLGMEVKVAGKLENDLKTNVFEMKNVIVGLDFMFDNKLLEMIGGGIRYHNGENGKEVDYSEDRFGKTAIQLVDKKQVNELKKMLGQYGYLPEKIKGLNQPILLSNIKMVFDSSSHTFHSVGELGVSFMGDKYVNRLCKGYIEFGTRQKGGDFFNLYIETNRDEKDERKWWYFNYKKGVVGAISSDPAFNDALMGIAEKKRQKLDKKTGEAYLYGVAPMQKRNEFVARMKGEADIAPEPTPTPETPAPSPNPETTPTPPTEAPAPPTNPETNPPKTDEPK